MSGTILDGTVPRLFTDTLSDRLSVQWYGATGDGVTDDAPFINDAIARLVSRGGRTLHFPGGNTYLLLTPIVIPSGVSNIVLRGDGDSTILRRGADMPDGKGVLDVESGASVVELSNFKIDGQTTTPTAYKYATSGHFDMEPMHDNLTRNSSVWVHGSVSNVKMNGVTIEHTGGYAVLLDARAGDINDVSVDSCAFLDNRPHTFGFTDGDLGHGSWTGGIHYQGDGSNYAVSNLSVSRCTFRRGTGNQVWGHLYAFGKLHRNISTVGCHFEDIGRDGILVGGVLGGAVQGNTFRRIGFMCSDDTSQATPDYLAGQYAVGLDTAGLVRGVNYVGNSFMSVNGACMDLDGYAEGTVSGNTCVTPWPEDPEYAEDQVALFGIAGTNYTYGLQVSNSNVNDAGESVHITGNTFINMPAGAVRMWAARGCVVQGNVIVHPAVVSGMHPIEFGNIGTTSKERSYNNVVIENTIHWEAGTAAPAVFERGTEFIATDRNWVSGNKLFGAYLYEFMKSALSASSTEMILSTASNSFGGVWGQRSEMVTARKAADAAATRHGRYEYTTWSSRVGVAAEVTSMILYDAWEFELSPGVWTKYGPLLNVSESLAVGTGAVSTGPRTQLAWADTVATGKLYGDSMLVLGEGTYDVADADLLDDTLGIIRWDNSGKQFLMSVSVTAGVRNWEALGGGSGGGNFVNLFGKTEQEVGLPPATQARIYYDSGLNKLRASRNGAAYQDVLTTVIDATGQAIYVTQGYITTQGGLAALGTNTDVIQAPAGGVTAKWLIGTESLTMTAAAPDEASMLSAVGQGRLIYKGGKFKTSVEGGAFVDLLTSPVSQLVVSGADNSLQVPNGYIVTGAGYYTASASQEAYKAVNGGMAARQYNVYRVDGGGTGFDTVIDGFRNAAFRELSLSDRGVAGAGGKLTLLGEGTNQALVVENFGGALRLLGASAPNYYCPVHIFGQPGQVGLTIANGWVDSAAGFYTASASTEAVKALSGGVTSKWLITTDSFTMTSLGTPPSVSGAGQGKLYFDGTKFKLSENGGSWSTLLGTGLPFGSGSVLATGETNTHLIIEGTSSTSWLAPGFRVRRARAGYTDSVAGDQIAVFHADYWRSGGWREGFQFLVEVDGFPSATNVAAGLMLQSRAMDNSWATRWRFLSDGRFEVLSSYIYSELGFASNSSANEAVNIPNGGVMANKVTSKTAVYVATTTSTLASPAANFGGMHHKIGTTYRFWNGSVWFDADLGAIGAGGGLPQALGTGDSPTFSGLTLTGGGSALTLNSGYVQAGAGFYTPVNSTEAIKATYGGVSARSVNIYQSAGGGGAWQVINSVGAFVGNGVDVGAYGVRCRGVNPAIGGTQYYGMDLQVNIMTSSGYKTFTWIGGSLVNYW